MSGMQTPLITEITSIVLEKETQAPGTLSEKGNEGRCCPTDGEL